MLRFTAAAFLTACGLDESGTLETIDGGADVSSQDVIADVVSEPGPPLPCSTDASVCTSGLLAGWTPIAFAPSRATACPANFTSDDLVTSPQAQADACTCNCTPGLAPSCAIGTLTGTFGATSQCLGGNNSFNVTTDGQCYDWGGSFSLALFHEWNKLPLTPGTCTSSATLDTNKVSVTNARACKPPPQCEEDVCSGSPPAGFASCIATDNDVACPPGPFTSKTVVASSVQFNCSACSACTNTGTGCGTAKVDYYQGSTCTTAVATDSVDGMCDGSNTGISSITHFKYSAPVLGATCTPGTSTAAPTPAHLRTLCCRP